MPHFPKPYFRKNRQTWTVQINGHQHNLGRDRDAAFKQYHELMATSPQKKGHHSHVIRYDTLSHRRH